jgi:ribosomal protein S12 methylthiotransferase accessory factor
MRQVERPAAGIDEMEQHLLSRLTEFGITRVADTTGLDRTGIPTASAVRPGTRDVIWVYSGKGPTQAHARVGAVMETLERTSALWPTTAAITVATADDLRRSGTAVWQPTMFTEARRPGMDDGEDQMHAWVQATQLRGQDPVWVPADLVHTGHRPPGIRAVTPFPTRTSNGLGAGPTREHAIRHALLEIAERDITSHHEILASHAGVSFLAFAARTLALPTDWLAADYRDDTAMSMTLDLETLPDVARGLLTAFTDAGLRVVVKALPNDLGLPTFAAACLDQFTMGGILACAGYATRTSCDEAVTAALLELAQTRATDLQGAREDRHDVEKRRLVAAPGQHWLTTPDTPVSYPSSVGGFSRRRDHSTPSQDVDDLMAAFAAVGLHDIAVTDFPSPDGVHAVRVVAPGAETWHATGGEGSLGPRLALRTAHA